MCWAGAGGKANGTGGHGVANQGGHFFNFSRCGFAFVGVLAHDPSANRRVANVSRNIDGALLAFEHGQILWKGFKVPINAMLQNLQGHALHLRQIAHGEFSIFGAARRNGEAAVANDRGGHAQSRGRANMRVPGNLGVKVSV